jgi:hypothetical protein
MGGGVPQADGSRRVGPGEFVKPAGKRCPHQRTGKGCTIYHKRPRCCELWNCRWLGNPEETVGLKRPDRSHCVVDIAPDFIMLRDDEREAYVEVVQIWVDPDYPDAYKTPEMRAYMARMGEKGIATIIRYSNKDAFVIFPPAMTRDGQWKENRGTMLRETTVEETFKALSHASRVRV